MGEQPCSLVIEHQKILGELASDVKHIKGKIDNGLSAKLAIVNETLVKFMATSIADRRVDKAENWFGRIVQGSATKIIGLAVVIVMASGLTSSGLNILAKQYISQEPPGQQKAILEQGEANNLFAVDMKIMISDMKINKYHRHILNDGRILFHNGSPDVRAYILNSTTGKFERCPEMRTEATVK